jgi:hypothetical protein
VTRDPAPVGSPAFEPPGRREQEGPAAAGGVAHRDLGEPVQAVERLRHQVVCQPAGGDVQPVGASHGGIGGRLERAGEIGAEVGAIDRPSPVDRSGAVDRPGPVGRWGDTDANAVHAVTAGSMSAVDVGPAAGESPQAQVVGEGTARGRRHAHGGTGKGARPVGVVARRDTFVEGHVRA